MLATLMLCAALPAFLDNNPTSFTADNTTRIAIGRDQDNSLLIKVDTKRGPRTDGFKEVDVSLFFKDKDAQYFVIQSQSVFDQLDLTQDEIDQVGNALAALHKTGDSVITYGAKDESYAKARNTDVLKFQDGQWTRYDATNASSVKGFQQLADNNLGVRIGNKLGAMKIDAFLAAVTNDETIRFADGQWIDIPADAKLSPRMVDEHKMLVLAYNKKDNETVIATPNAKGTALVTKSYMANDDVVGNALPYATITDGAVDGKVGYIHVDDSGNSRRTTGMSFTQLLRQQTAQQASPAK